MSRCRITGKIKKRTQANSASGTCFSSSTTPACSAGPYFGPGHRASRADGQPRTGSHHDTVARVRLDAWRGPSLVKGPVVGPGTGRSTTSSTQSNSTSLPPAVDLTSRTADAVHAGRWHQALSVRAANTPRRGTARPPGSVGGRRSGQGRTRAPAEHRHRASGIARRRGTHPSPDRRTSPEKAARRQSCAPLPRQPPNQQHGKNDQ
jgi:hypothetical protein